MCCESNVIKKLLEKLALVDSLTEIYNRRFYELDIRKVWNGCKRENKAISLALLDIDYFKSYNDEYGHLSGDEALRLVAKHIKKSIKNGPMILLLVMAEKNL